MRRGEEAAAKTLDRLSGGSRAGRDRPRIARKFGFRELGERATGLAASFRSVPPGRAGHRSMCAQIAAAAASTQPPSRAGTSEKETGIVTGRMNVSSAEVAAAAK